VSALAQTSIGDLDISTGNLVVSTDVAQNAAWKLANRFSFFKGEWFVDTRQGLPFVQYVLVANPNLRLISDLYSSVIRSIPSIAAVQSLNLDYQPGARTLSLSFQATTNDGAVITGGTGQPFIVQTSAAA
jgi:hypothetical protein